MEVSKLAVFYCFLIAGLHFKWKMTLNYEVRPLGEKVCVRPLNVIAVAAAEGRLEDEGGSANSA